MIILWHLRFFLAVRKRKNNKHQTKMNILKKKITHQ